MNTFLQAFTHESPYQVPVIVVTYATLAFVLTLAKLTWDRWGSFRDKLSVATVGTVCCIMGTVASPYIDTAVTSLMRLTHP